MTLLALALFSGILALLFAVVTARRVLREDPGTDAMQAIVLIAGSVCITAMGLYALGGWGEEVLNE